MNRSQRKSGAEPVRGYQPSRLFTVQEANAMLPLVRAITTDLAQLAQEVIDRRQRLDHLTAGRDISAGNPYDDELAQIEEELEKDTRRLQEYIEELRQLGVEPKGPEGLVDFPAMIDNRPVFLCWRLGEPEVAHYHDIDAGFSGRRPLAVAGSVIGPGFSDESQLL
jgi:hypothetical protein